MVNLDFVDEIGSHPLFGYSVEKNALVSRGSIDDVSSIRPAQLSPSPRIIDLSGAMRAFLGKGIWLKTKVSIFFISSKRLFRSPKLSVDAQPNKDKYKNVINEYVIYFFMGTIILIK
jgi:hypothetical protein